MGLEYAVGQAPFLLLQEFLVQWVLQEEGLDLLAGESDRITARLVALCGKLVENN